jgi:hypothetical protein
MVQEKYAYIDECGNTNLDTSLENVSTHYIITAIVVDSEELKRLKEEFEEVRSIEFQSGEMKSNKVNKDNRRLRILKRLSGLNYRIYCLAIDKRELKSKGYQYQEVFFKNLNAKLYRILFKDFAVLNIFTDEYKTTDFMKGFKQYLSKRFQPDLFTKYDIQFIDSKSEVLVQGADIIGGSIARHFDEKLKSPNSTEFLKILEKNIYTIEPFPPVYTPYVVPVKEGSENQFDQIVEKTALLKATLFVKEHENSGNSKKQDQVQCIKLLLNHHFFHPKNFFSTNKLLRDLNEVRAEKLEEHELRTSIIAKLREDKVLIVSRTKGGYKIPSSVNDMLNFVNLASSQIVPLLRRVKLARKLLFSATDGKLDILDRDEHEVLREAMKAIKCFD